jgi:hypothetical protein
VARYPSKCRTARRRPSFGGSIATASEAKIFQGRSAKVDCGVGDRFWPSLGGRPRHHVHCRIRAQAAAHDCCSGDAHLSSGHWRHPAHAVDIPAVSVVWTYNGMRAKDIQNQILSAGPASVSRRTSPLADRSTGARRVSPPNLAIRIADQDDAMAASRMQTVSMNEQVAGPE